MLASSESSAPDAAPFRIGFANTRGGAATLVQISAPWLSGALTEEIFEPALPLGEAQAVRLFRTGDLLLGYAQEPFVASELAARTESLYRRIFAATEGRHLYRIWNYVPEINAHTAGLEHYRAFCQGRSVAFESSMGGQFEPRLPAASAVGSDGTTLEVLFVAGKVAPVHFENPTQIPAYHYPAEHGPRAPTFARATVASAGAQTFTFISGTSAIKGHQTISPGVLQEQLDCTVDNLRVMSRVSGLGDNLQRDRVATRHFKIYLRHAADLAVTQAHLEQSLLRASDRVTYLRADICRAALNIEIEATIVR